MSLKEKVDELNSMISQFKIIEAFDKFYADNLIMQENNEEAREGKAINREIIHQGLLQIDKWHFAKVLSAAVNEQDELSFTEWEMNRTLKGGGNTIHKQVAVQKWKDGKIINERFYYSLSDE